MKPATILTSTAVLVVLVAAPGQAAAEGVPSCVDDPAEPLVDLPPLPHIEEYSDTGCRDIPGDDPQWWPCDEDDVIEFAVEGNALHVLHRNAVYNCCPDDIAISLAVEGPLLRLTEEEILGEPCDCNCCYDVEATVVDLAPGEYTVEFCWYDYGTGQEQCYVEDIVIAGGRKLGQLPILEAAPEPIVLPHIGEYSNSGCLDDPGGNGDPDWWPCEGDDVIELTGEADTLHVLHRNALYNCCPDDIVISLSVQGQLLELTEEEILTDPCYCVCCYEVEATVVGLAPGEYTVEFCWYDYPTGAVECHTADILIPG